jgi:hypothetical protein
MKTLRLPLFAVLASLLITAPFCLRAADAPDPTAETLYLGISSPDMIDFEKLRHAKADGTELILSTIKATAAEQAKFAGYVGEVIVLDEGAKAPDGARYLLLSWSRGDSTATFMQGGKEKYLGVVNRTPLREHPNYQSMRTEIDSHQMRDTRQDAELRAAAQMNVYMALKYLRQHLGRAAKG